MKNRLATLDWNKWLNNTLVFLAPLGVLYFVFVQAGIQADGFQWADFRPDDAVIGAMVLYVINVLLDFFKKFKAAA